MEEELFINSEKIESEPIRDELGRLKKGVILNPNGRPKGSISPITKIKQIFEEKPEVFQEFVTEYMADPANRKHLVEMLDGKPRQNIGLDGGETGLAIQFANVFNKNAQEDK